MTTGLVLILLSGLVIAWGLVVGLTAIMLARPRRRGYSYALARGLPGEPGELVLESGRRVEHTAWSFRSRGVDLPVWDIAGHEPRGPVVIITHGWSDSRVVMLSRVPTMLAHASRVLLWDLPAHGEAPGKCTLGVREPDDLRALIAHVGGTTPVVLYGFSMGAGTSLAAGRAQSAPPIAAIIAEAPYRVARTPAERVLELRALPHRVTLVPALMLLGQHPPKFDRASDAKEIPGSTRVIVVHSPSDEVCPVEDGREIAAAAASGEFVELPPVAHARAWIEPESKETLRGVVARVLANCRQTEPGQALSESNQT